MHRLTLLILVLLSSTAAWAAKIVDTAVLEGRVLCVNDDGSVSAWSTETGEADDALAEVLSARPISRIASDGSTLWGLSGASLLRLSAAKDAWVEHSSLATGSEAWIDLLALGPEPVVVYPSKVVRPLVSRTYTVPRLGGQFPIDRLRVLAQFVEAPDIYFGTGQGEWGGHLVRLDTDRGTWSFHYDPLHYATGITRANPDELVVTWSMSHFTAEALVRVHRRDTTVKHEYPVLESKYFQAVAFGAAQEVLYAIEQNGVVELEDGLPHRIADLGKLPYEPEPKAIGVAPGVLALVPLPDGSLLIVHRSSPPMLLRKGKLQRLSWPGG